MTATSESLGDRSPTTAGKTAKPLVAHVTSRDGTRIAYERLGEGPPLILVDGALCSRSFGPTPKLAPRLARQFQVIAYDRRGRGESGDTKPYAIEREIEDLAALVDVAGRGASIYGSSSGAALAIRAAGSGLGIEKLALYEPPFVMEGSPGPLPPDRMAEIEQMVAAGRPGDAAKTFLRMVGMPAVFLPIMRVMPGVWSKITAVAHTLPYDFAALGHSGANTPLPADLSRAMAAIDVPTLVGVGGKSPGWMRHTAQTVAKAIARATLRVVDGQTHTISAKAAEGMLVDFLGGAGG